MCINKDFLLKSMKTRDCFHSSCPNNMTVYRNVVAGKLVRSVPHSTSGIAHHFLL